MAIKVSDKTKAIRAIRSSKKISAKFKKKAIDGIQKRSGKKPIF